MIVVTGGAGYIGSHVVLTLVSQGFDVVIFDNLENGHEEILEALKKINGKAINFVRGDLKNPEESDRLFKQYDVDAVMHFAAYINVEESAKNPSKYYNNNLIGALNLITNMVKNNVDKIIFSSTAAIYGQQKYTPIDELHPKNPVNPYGHSKLLVEQILNQYDIAYNLKSVCLRYFNVVGADAKTRIGEWHEPETHLIPNILAATRNSKNIFQLYGDNYNTKDGTCVRDYLNVEDLADAHVLALRHLINGGASDSFNLGTASGYTIMEILEACEKVIGKKIRIQVNGRRAGDPAVLVADNRKATEVLKWTPKRHIEDSVETAYKWLIQLENRKQFI